ncbi:E3 ubiquitin-protein ligase TRIM17-like [Engraulis encrasicolus]|uniref:E3 ubiquitin-protein ligase TRIM17-like n=1 Tax=Engraulis encrasicolus TaxID=184585 RepID=UPI002FD24E3C
MSSTTSGSRRSSLASAAFSLSSAWTRSSTASSRRASSPGSRPASSASSTGSAASAGLAGCSHGEREMVIYCDTCSLPLCDECLEGDTHPGHNFKTIEEACQDQQNKLAEQLRYLRAKLAEQGDIQQWTRRQKEHLEGEIKQARDHLNRQYEQLTTLLTGNEEQAMRLLDVQRDSQRKPLYRLQEDTERYNTQGKRLQEQIASLKDRIKSTSSADGQKPSASYYADILVSLEAFSTVGYIVVVSTIIDSAIHRNAGQDNSIQFGKCHNRCGILFQVSITSVYISGAS